METRVKLTGELNPCKCGKQPQLIHTTVGNKHYMSCPPCGVRLWSFDSAGEAVQHWESLPLFQSIPAEAG